MAAGTALKKISARVKQLKKKHPGAKYKTLQKQAGAEYRSGKLKKRKPAKKRVAKKVVRKKSAPRKRKRSVKAKVITRTIVVGSVKQKRKRAYAKRKVKVRVRVRRRVSGSGTKSILPIALLIGGGLLAWKLLQNSQPTPQYLPTGNYTTDNKAQEVLAWATAANLGLSAIANLINAFNTKGSVAVDQAYNNIQNNQDPLAGLWA